MDKIKKRDAMNVALSVLQPVPMVVLLGSGFLAYQSLGMEAIFPYFGLGVFVAAGIYYVKTAHSFFEQKRFKTFEHAQLWKTIRDRQKRFKSALKSSPNHISVSLETIPKQVEQTAKQLYQSLREADLVKAEIIKSEGLGGLSGVPYSVHSSDKETTELYLLADKNVADYRKHFQSVSAVVTRTEAQCAVFISALDALRVQLLGHRLSREDDSIGREQFREKMTDIKTQLSSINSALLELNLPSAVREENQLPLDQG